MLSGGAQDYLVKPFAFEELRARVQNLVSMKRVKDVLRGALDDRAIDAEQLARDLVQRERELQTALDSMRIAREQAEKASRMKTDFLGMVSHELRTPLATLDLQGRLLERDQDDGIVSPPERVTRVTRAVMRLRSLIDGLLEYARIEQGKLALQIEDTDIRELLRDVIEELRDVPGQLEGAAMKVDAADVPHVWTDPRLLRLIVHNLVSNARKFSDGGPVVIGAVVENGGLVITVDDQGPGIAEETIDRMFEPFWQGASPTGKHLPGIGLGLAIVQEMTKALDGTIEVDSQLGRGSSFRVRLPVEAVTFQQPDGDDGESGE